MKFHVPTLSATVPHTVFVGMTWEIPMVSPMAYVDVKLYDPTVSPMVFLGCCTAQSNTNTAPPGTNCTASAVLPLISPRT